MTLQILDGALQSTLIPLKKDYVFQGASFSDPDMHNSHAKIGIDSSFNWKINGLSGNKIRISSEEVESVSLLPGLIFHLGQTGFKVVNRAPATAGSWEKSSADFLDNMAFIDLPLTDLHFFLVPVQILFLQGPQSGNIYTLSYGPRVLGSNNLDLNLVDPSQPHELLRFSQVGDKVIIENLADDAAVMVNKNSFKQHALNDVDRFSFGSNIVEISLLK